MRLVLFVVVVWMSTLPENVVPLQENDHGHYPLSWNSSKIEFEIPRNFPPNKTIFGLRILSPPKSASTEDNEPTETGTCGRERRSVYEDPPARRKARETSAVKERRRNRGDGSRKDTSLGMSRDSTARSKRVDGRRDPFPSNRNWKEEKDRKSHRNKNKFKKKYGLGNNTKKLFKLVYSNEDEMIYLQLTRELGREDFTGVRDFSVNVVIFMRNCSNSKNPPIKLHEVKLLIMEQFDCDKPVEAMCMLPSSDIALHQWENRPSSVMLKLPSLNLLCPRIQKEIRVTMTDLDAQRKPELRYNKEENALHAEILDRELRDFYLNMTITCSLTLNSKQRVRTSRTGFLRIEDENDCPPVALRSQELVWNFPKHPKHIERDQTSIKETNKSES